MDPNQNGQVEENQTIRSDEITPEVSPKKSEPIILSYPVDIYSDPSQVSNMHFDETFKLILIGNSGVGKSCVIRRIGSNSFSDDHEVTIGAEFTTIAAHVNKKSFIKMQLWDSCGQESAQSLRDLEKVWIQDIQSNLKDAMLILVGNKVDIDDENRVKGKRQVTYEEGIEFKQKHNLNYFTEVSAKTGKGIKELVEYIARQLYHRSKEEGESFNDSKSKQNKAMSSAGVGANYQASVYYQQQSGNLAVGGKQNRKGSKKGQNTKNQIVLKKKLTQNSKNNKCC